MKTATLIYCLTGTLALAGCVTVKHQLTDPNVAARFDSAKTSAEFAQCAAAKLTPDFALEQDGTSYSLTRKRGIVVLSRWDFFPTNNGSQAELRNGAKDAAGADQVKSCA